MSDTLRCSAYNCRNDRAVANSILNCEGICLQQIHRRHQHSRRAEPALKTVLFAKLGLDRIQLIRRAQALDRHDISTIGSHSQRQARANAVAIHEDGAGPANAVLAADMRPGKPDGVADEIGKQQTRLNTRRIFSSVYRDNDIHLHRRGPAARVHAVLNAFSASAPIRLLRYSAETWMSLSGVTHERTTSANPATASGPP